MRRNEHSIFSCPNCDRPLTIPDELAGKRRKCPKCGDEVYRAAGRRNASRGCAASRDPRPKAGREAALATDHPLLLMRPVRGPRREPRRHDGDGRHRVLSVDLLFGHVAAIGRIGDQSAVAAGGRSGPAGVQTATDVTNDPKYIVVTIDEDDSVWVGDEQVFGESNLRAKLKAARKSDSSKSGMLVVGDAEASHGTLVMVLDAGADAGMQDLLFSVREGGEAAGG